LKRNITTHYLLEMPFGHGCANPLTSSSDA
jgi:hypothetical protein